MAFADCTAIYVDVVSYSKYATQTADTPAFEAVKTMQSVYLNPNTCALPDVKYTHALALLVLHHYALGSDVKAPDVGGPDTSVGAITSERVGKLTQTRGAQPYIGTVKGSNTYLLQTKWGTEFLFLMKSFKSSPSVT